MKNDLKFAVIIPAHNEELVIGATLASVLEEVDKKDVYLVDDGSKDKTSQIARKLLAKNNVLTIPNGGKAKALNSGLSNFKILERYQLVMIHDADTRMVSGFVSEVKKVFAKDTKKKIACAMGHVLGQPKNWVAAYRVWEYEIGQAVHKQAQSYINGVTVAPGCSSVYRSEILVKLGMPQGTMTEDMDLTFAVHRERLGRMVYVPNALMITQDPQTLNDFHKQIRRWYGGFWQCVFKHRVPWGGQVLDAEISLLALESLFQPFLVLLTLIIAAISIRENNYWPVAVPFALDFGMFMIPTLGWAAFRRNNWKILRWIGHFYFLRTMSSFVFTKSFFDIALKGESKKNHIWTTKRYKVDNSALPSWLRLRTKLKINS